MAHKQTRQSSLALSMPNFLLRLEGMTVFVGAILLYAAQGFSGLTFLLLILAPDLGMLGYMVNPRVGSIIYNIAHLYTLPAVLMGIALVTNTPVAFQVGLIWAAHIGMDRVAGYGFKFPTEFKDTHLQRV